MEYEEELPPQDPEIEPKQGTGRERATSSSTAQSAAEELVITNPESPMNTEKTDAGPSAPKSPSNRIEATDGLSAPVQTQLEKKKKFHPYTAPKHAKKGNVYSVGGGIIPHPAPTNLPAKNALSDLGQRSYDIMVIDDEFYPGRIEPTKEENDSGERHQQWTLVPDCETIQHIERGLLIRDTCDYAEQPVGTQIHCPPGPKIVGHLKALGACEKRGEIWKPRAVDPPGPSGSVTDYWDLQPIAVKIRGKSGTHPRNVIWITAERAQVLGEQIFLPRTIERGATCHNCRHFFALEAFNPRSWQQSIQITCQVCENGGHVYNRLQNSLRACFGCAKILPPSRYTINSAKYASGTYGCCSICQSRATEDGKITESSKLPQDLDELRFAIGHDDEMDGN